jgi:hypothetical protein
MHGPGLTLQQQFSLPETPNPLQKDFHTVTLVLARCELSLHKSSLGMRWFCSHELDFLYGKFLNHGMNFSVGIHEEKNAGHKWRCDTSCGR